ncbi:NAD-dependent epimerase/dehydratase family protein [Saccharomonospora xinjiangensis]|uniref:NAD-dependent epimerase/dehydratase family protein n=1 Tax=Saccharomonospora xinjiangensis TaxID=75294 RepID=UPI0035104CF6
MIGGNGFIGRAVTHAVSASGNPVSVFTRQRPFTSNGQPHPALARSSVVVHVAGTITPATAEQRPDLAAQDITLLRAVLGSLRGTSRPPVFVLASSGGTIYSPHADLPHHEDAPLDPTSAYGTAKLAQERELRAAAWVTPVVLRLSNVYGAGQSAGAGLGVIAHWVRAVADGEPIRIIGQSRRDYLHITDAAAAFRAVVHQADRLRGTGATLNIGSGVMTSLDELHRQLENATGTSIPARREEPRPFDRQDSCLDITRARHVLGWSPLVPLATGLADALHEVLPARALRSGFKPTRC